MIYYYNLCINTEPRPQMCNGGFDNNNYIVLSYLEVTIIKSPPALVY